RAPCGSVGTWPPACAQQCHNPPRANHRERTHAPTRPDARARARRRRAPARTRSLFTRALSGSLTLQGAMPATTRPRPNSANRATGWGGRSPPRQHIVLSVASPEILRFLGVALSFRQLVDPLDHIVGEFLG